MRPRRGYEPILMDMDGTVVDSIRLTRESFRHAVQSVLAEELSDREMMAFVGQPLMQQMEQLSPEHATELYAAYREYNHRMHDELIKMFAGIEGTLRRLRRAERRLGMVTSKSTPTVEMAFRVLSIRDYFDAIVTASDTTRHKPCPEPLLLCLSRLATPGRPAEPAGAVYVGDSPFDIAAGRAAGMATIGVTWGIFPRQELESAGATHVAESPEDLAALCLGGC
jgi:pyrophosphatase PpaX